MQLLEEGRTVMVDGPGVKCPECGVVVAIQIDVQIENNDYAHLGEAHITTEPELSGLWVHMWGHERKAEVP